MLKGNQQSGKKEKTYISLKEAAQISGYSADYIGYLIRSGKIEGRAVYNNIAWQTTPEAILSYKHSQESKKRKKSKGFSLKEKLIYTFGAWYFLLKRELRLYLLVIRSFKRLIALFAFIFLFLFSLIFGYFYSQHSIGSNQQCECHCPTAGLRY